MRSSFEKTSIPGRNHAVIELDAEQKLVLREVSERLSMETMLMQKGNDDAEGSPHERKKYDSNLRNVVLFGGHGTGKTILGIEIAKMFLANLRKQKALKNINSQCALHIFDFVPNLIRYGSKKDIIKKTNLQTQLEKESFANENLWDTIKFWTIKELEDASQNQIMTELAALQSLKKVVSKMFAIEDENYAVLFIDEIRVADLLKQSNDSTQLDISILDFGSHPNLYTVSCLSPLTRIENKRNKLDPISFEHQNSSYYSHVLAREMKNNYRNCKEIQDFYTVFSAHYEATDVDDSTQETLIRHFAWHNECDSRVKNEDMKNLLGLVTLPLGQKPALFKLSKVIMDSTDEDILQMQEQATRIIGNLIENDGVSILCFYSHQDCRLCEKIKKYYETHVGRHVKMHVTRNILGEALSHDFNGCEDDVCITHFKRVKNDPSIYDAYEVISRPRKKLLMMIDKEDLKFQSPLPKVLHEIEIHEQKDCMNRFCKSGGWTRKKVMDVYESI